MQSLYGKGDSETVSSLIITGCFDIVHIGHLKIFKYAKQLADEVIIAIDSDSKVKKDKGPDRPINNELDRKEFLENILGISKVIVFNSEEELKQICQSIKPDYRLVGSDWKGKKIVGDEYCKEIIFFDRISDYSTTSIIEKIKNDLCF